MVKDLVTMQLTRKFDYFYGIQHLKIITRITGDNIVLEHIIFLGISHNF